MLAIADIVFKLKLSALFAITLNNNEATVIAMDLQGPGIYQLLQQVMCLKLHTDSHICSG